MKREQITNTLLNARIARTNEQRAVHLLLGIYNLLYAIAEDMDIFEDEKED